jgi:DNA-binding MarR family transcriptional regulator
MAEATDLGVLMGLAYGAFVTELNAALADEGFPGLHRSFGYVARALAEREYTIKELAGLLGLTPQGAVKVVDELQADGFVERVADAADGRVRRVRLTARGREVLAHARAFHARYEAERLAPGEAAAFRSVLERLAGAGEAARVIRPM